MVISNTPADRETLRREAEIVLHCAATVRFDEDLSRAIRMNVGSVRQYNITISRYNTIQYNTIDTMQVRSIAKLCQDMPRLVALVHVSTAYCHCQEAHIQVTE